MKPIWNVPLTIYTFSVLSLDGGWRDLAESELALSEFLQLKF